MNAETKYYTIKGTPDTIHLGSAERGLRTYCGKLISKSGYRTTTFAESEHPVAEVIDAVTCTACKQTGDWKYAMAAAFPGSAS